MKNSSHHSRILSFSLVQHPERWCVYSYCRFCVEVFMIIHWYLCWRGTPTNTFQRFEPSSSQRTECDLLSRVCPEAMFDIACFKQRGDKAGHRRSKAGENRGSAVACTHIRLDSPIRCVLYSAVTMLGHTCTERYRILSVQFQIVS